MNQQFELSLIQEELKIISNSSDLFRERIDFLIQKFYNNFLQTRAGSLFYFINMENQFNSFGSSIRMIFLFLEEPDKVINKMDSLIVSHSHLKMKLEYIDEFTSSLLLAFKEIYSNFLADDIITSYTKIIFVLMNHFKDALPFI